MPLAGAPKVLSHPGPRACTLVALGTSSPFSPIEVTLAVSPLPPPGAGATWSRGLGEGTREEPS